MMKYRSVLTARAWTGPLPTVFRVPVEYRPKWAVASSAFKETGDYKRYQAHIATLPMIAVARDVAPGERIAMDRVGPSTFEITFSVDTPAQITARQAFFPTWKLSDIATGIEIPIGPSNENGLISAALPAGQSQLRLSVEPSRSEKLGGAVSSMTIFLCLLILIAPLMRSWRLGPAHANQSIGIIKKIAARLCPPLFGKRN